MTIFPVAVIKCFSSNNPVMRTTTHGTEISIFPNPSQTEFTCIVTSEEDQLISLRVFDHAGRIVESQDKIISNETFTFGNNISAGFYFVEINSASEKEIFKIVKVE